MSNRTKYSKEFKLDAVNLVLEQGYSQTDAGKALSINPKMLSRWIKEHQADDGHASIVCDALRMAIWQRKPAPGLIVHSDRGSQYASKAYRLLLNTHKCTGSMSRKGNCWDNAVAESFFGSLKQERVQWRHYQTRSEAQLDILDYITMFYNNHRLHSYLEYRSPKQFEDEKLVLKKVA
ncbi:MAG: IS3 family transposase [Legionellaceae bacterium]|nr:IS3 family transposase [Legionellaceae bacterium]